MHGVGVAAHPLSEREISGVGRRGEPSAPDTLLERQWVMETLQALRRRIGGFNQNSLPMGEGLNTNPGLRAKVGPEGDFLPFEGNTVVYTLPKGVCEDMEHIQEMLYDRCSGSLAQRLSWERFHITLHDLVSGTPCEQLRKQIERTEPEARLLMEELARLSPIQMKSTYLFNMVNTSLVLGFEPVDEESCARLLHGYERLQSVVALPYSLTPHVTLGYFRPGHLSRDQVEAIREVIEDVKALPSIQVELTGELLRYQCFTDMDHYT